MFSKTNLDQISSDGRTLIGKRIADINHVIVGMVEVDAGFSLFYFVN